MVTHDVRRHLSAAWAHFDELYRTLTNNSDRIAIVTHAEELQYNTRLMSHVQCRKVYSFAICDAIYGIAR